MEDLKIKLPSSIVDVPKKEPTYVKSLESLFEDCPDFKGDLSGWDVSEVMNMNNMFKGALSFNSDLSSWKVDHFEEKPEGFDDNTPMWTLPKPLWNIKEEVPEEKPTNPEEKPDPNPDPEKPGNGGGEQDKPSKPEENSPENNDVDNYLCPCDGNTIIDFPVGDGFDVMNFRAEARISCFEKQPSVMEPINTNKSK